MFNKKIKKDIEELQNVVRIQKNTMNELSAKIIALERQIQESRNGVVQLQRKLEHIDDDFDV